MRQTSGQSAAWQQLIAHLTGELHQGECEWPEVLRLARWHAVAPLLASRYADSTDVLLDTRAELLQIARKTAEHNLHLTSELLQILHAFDTAGLQALAYKGPALAYAAYGDLAKRGFGDLDLLLRPQDISRARQALEAQGFVPWAEFANLTPAQEQTYLRSGYHYQYCQLDGSVPVELHWNVAPRSFVIELPVERLFARAVRVSMGRAQAPAPSHEDHLVLLCIHGAKHMWDRVGLIVDVGELVRANQAIDWDYLLRFAAQLHARRMVLLGLTLANQVWSVDLPSEITEAARQDGAVAKLAERVMARLPLCHDSDEYRMEAHRFYFDVRERASDKLRYVARLMFEPSLNDARALGSSPRAAKAGGWLRPLRVAGVAARHSLGAMFRR